MQLLASSAHVIVKDVLRNTKEGFSDLIMVIACGLHNFRSKPETTTATMN